MSIFNLRETNSCDIAIIGMAGRFPGARSVEQFWENICNRVEAISFFSKEELAAREVSPVLLENANFVKAAALLEDKELFDAAFFGYSPKEAEIIDPQQRHFLECAWEAFEDAGYDTSTYQGSIGVFASANISSYLLNHIYANAGVLEHFTGLQRGLGNDKDYLASRISYHLNLRGPSVVIQTACSSSLVAVHLACQSLLGGECDMALAGGVAIECSLESGYLYQEGGIASSDGHCRPFDARANGSIFGSGLGAVILKRLEDALEENDHIYAVIKGSAINNDGSSKVGYTAPSEMGQAQVIRQAHLMADVDPISITYIEAHGTGTPLGDLIELNALKQVFKEKTAQKQFCAIGSVKSNIGHLDVAAGIAGLIKTALALKYKVLPPTLHFEIANPQVDLANSPFYVNTVLTPWRTASFPLRAGISSFGIGGTNAHAVLEEAPVNHSDEESRPYYLLLLSAKTDTALEKACKNLAHYLTQKEAPDLADVAYTLQAGRRRFPHRRAVVCRDKAEALVNLQNQNGKYIFTSYQETRDRPVMFLFPGAGSEYVNMGAELYRTEPVFREQLNQCIEIIRRYSDLDLLLLLYPDQDESASHRFDHLSASLLALFVVEYALARLWISWGVHPQAMIGHSQGEYVAACIAEVLSLEDAIKLVLLRIQLFEQLPLGAMLQVSLSPKEIEPFLSEEISLAAINGPSLCLLSGKAAAIERIEHHFAAQGIEAHRVRVNIAAHSVLLDPLLATFAEHIRKIHFKSPRIPYISSVTGAWITKEEVKNPNYWVCHLRQTVLFAQGIQKILEDVKDIALLEVGPGNALHNLVRHILDETRSDTFGGQPGKTAEPRLVLFSLPRGQDQLSETAVLLSALGQLWLSGVSIDWQQFHAHGKRTRLSLPTYPFERQRYWIDLPTHAQKSTHDNQYNEPEAAKLELDKWFYLPSWKQTFPPLLSTVDELLAQKSSWLIFSDGTVGNDSSFGGVLCKRLKEAGHTVVRVGAADSFSKSDEHVYTVNPQDQGDYERLWEDLANREITVEKIVHCWMMLSPEDLSGNEPWPNLDTIQLLGFYSLLFFVQALGKMGMVHHMHMWVLSSNMQSVMGEEISLPERVTILGLCRVIPQEYQYISCHSIDINTPLEGVWGKKEQEELIDDLLVEFQWKRDDAVVAYRNGQRWVQVFEQIRLDKGKHRSVRLRENGVYVITGGLGGIGLTLADYFAQRVKSTLLLLSRSAFPQREDWQDWIATHDAQNEISHKISKLQMLEKYGAKCYIIQTDVTNRQQMEETIRNLQKQFGQIHGIVHAAGSVEEGTIQLKSHSVVESVLAPKVKGTLLLDAILGNADLDFLILCSSLVSVVGGFGLADYCAANIFLNTFAQKKNAQGGMFTLSIAWDVWQQVGWTANKIVPHHLERLHEERLKYGIMPEEGIEAFDRLFHVKVPCLLISVVDLQRQFQREKLFRPIDAQGDIGSPAQETTSYARPDLDTPYVAPRTEQEKKLATIWQQLFGIDSVGIHDNFFELGGDSFLGIRLIALAKNAGFQLTTRQLFEYNTIATLALLSQNVS